MLQPSLTASAKAPRGVPPAQGTAKCLVSLKPRGEGERWDTKSKFTTMSHGASKVREQRSKISTTV